MSLSKFKKWYEPKFEITSNSYPFETRELPSSALAKLVRKLVKFWFAHWTWIITTLVAIAAILASLFIYFDSKAERNANTKSANQVTNTGQQSSQLIHNQSTLPAKVKLPQAKTQNKETSSTEKASRTYARQQIERWRKEIQAFVSNGGSFNKTRYIESSTYIEMYPFLSRKTIGMINSNNITVIEDGSYVLVCNDVLLSIYEDLDRIAAK